MKHPERLGRLLLFVRAAVATGLLLLIAVIWVIGYLSPFRTGRAVLAYHHVWLTKGHEVACASGEIQLSLTVRQYWEGDAESSLNEFLDTGPVPVTGWYCERILPYAIAASSPTDSAMEHMGIYLVSERLVSDDERPTGIIIPCWLLMALSLGIASPVYVGCFNRRRAEGRLLKGCCARCGYDLRASNCVCSECGTAVAIVRRCEA